MVLVPPTTGGPAALSADMRELMELQTLPGNYTQGPPQARAPALLSALPDSPALPLRGHSQFHFPNCTCQA